MYTRHVFMVNLLTIVVASYGVFSQTLGRLPVKTINNRTSAPVPYAHVGLAGTQRLCSTRVNGVGMLDSIPSGIYSLTAVAEGYDTLVQASIYVGSGANTPLVLRMSPSKVINLGKMVVVGKRMSEKRPSQSTSVSRITAFELSNSAGTGNDINRVLARQPSVTGGSSSDFENTLLVRGGHSLENVYVVDGIEFDNANHFSMVNSSGGNLGFINSALLSGLDFYAGGIPVSMPPRLSSVIDARLRPGAEEARFEIDLNMSGIGLTAEGPIGDKLTYLVNGRYISLRVLDRFFEVEGVPQFGDGLLKLMYTPCEQHTLRLVGVGSYDNYHESENVLEYPIPTTQNQRIIQGGAILGWDFQTNWMRSRTEIIANAREEVLHDDNVNQSSVSVRDSTFYNVSEHRRSGRDVDALVEPTDTMYVFVKGYHKNRLWEKQDARWSVGLKEHMTLFPNEKDILIAGFGLYNKRFAISEESSEFNEHFWIYHEDSTAFLLNDTTYDLSFQADSALDVQHVGGYLEYIAQRGRLKTVLGVRGDYYTIITDYGISPRLGLQYEMPTVGTFSASGGLYYQFPSSFSTLLEHIIAAPPGQYDGVEAELRQVRLQRNWQAVLGYERTFAQGHLLAVEGYMKWYDREYPYVRPGEKCFFVNDGNSFRWLLDNQIGKKRVYGAEVHFQKKKTDGLYYGLAASVFTAENKYTDGNWYNDNNSIRGKLGITLGANIKSTHGISLYLELKGGKPYTPIRYNQEIEIFEYDGTKYFSRFLAPEFSSNLRYTLRLNPSWGDLTAYIEVWNLFNLQPVIRREFSGYAGYIDYNANGILPVAGITFDF